MPKDKPWSAFMEKSNWRVRTIKLRGQLSQGLIINPQNLTPEEMSQIYELPEGTADVTKILGIEKYEKPLPTMTSSFKCPMNATGKFPQDIPKTDEARI